MENFRKVWQQLYNPCSGCPDVELDHVLCVMASVASDYKTGNSPDKWVLAYIYILNKTTIWDVRMSWSSMTIQRDNYSDFEEYEVAQNKSYQQVDKSIEKLVDAKKIIKNDEGGLNIRKALV